MKSLLRITFALFLFALGAQGMAEELRINVKAYTTIDGKRLPVSGLHIYRVTSAGKKTDYHQTSNRGDLWNGQRDERITVSKVGRLSFEYMVWDGAFYDPSRGDFIRVSNTEPESRKGSFTVDCNAVSGNETEVSVEVHFLDPSDAKHRLGEAMAKGRLREGGTLAPEGDDGAREGEYEKFDVRFAVPADSLKPTYRIVAQPVWIDKTANLTYYGDPLAYYGRKYYTTMVRESGFRETDEQRGFLFFDQAPRTPGEAYALGKGAVADPLADYSLTYRDTLHYATRGGKADPDNLYFRVPFRIKVADGMETHDCAALVRWVVTDYTDILSEHCDTVIEGRSDPLRFLSYNVGGFLHEKGDPVSDGFWFPVRADGTHEAKTDLRIAFETGRTDIDWNRGDNARQRQKAETLVANVTRIEDNDIREVEIVGYASPDGGYAHNQQLAAGRVQTFRTYLQQTMPRLRSYIVARAEVAPWSMVADTLQAWTGRDLSTCTQDAAQASTALRAAVGDSLYLAALDAVRVIKFNVKYEIKAAYTDQELLEKYRDRTLSQDFMYVSVYRYLAGQGDWEGAERVCQEIYDRKYKEQPRNPRDPDSMADLLLYANDLCAIKLHRAESDTALLAPFVKNPDRAYADKRRRVVVKGIPDMPLLNQASAYLLCKKYGMARGLMNFYRSRGASNSADAQLVSDLIEANHRVTREHVERLGRISPLNRVVCTLALSDASGEELASAKETALNTELLSDTVAVNNIVRALCYGREYGRRNGSYKVTDFYDTELEEGAGYLRTALRQDPSLGDIAFSQRDLKPLFKVMDRMKADEDVIYSIQVERSNRLKQTAAPAAQTPVQP